MRIGLDTHGLIMEKNRGIGNYAKDLYNTLAKIDDKNTYFLLNWGNKTAKPILTEMKNVEEYFVNQCDREVLHQSDFCESVIRDFVTKYDLDAFYSCNVHDFVLAPYRKEWFGKTLLTGTMYDLIPWMMQDDFIRTSEWRETFVKYYKNCAEYDLIFSISEHTRKDAEEQFGLSNIQNIYMASSKKPYQVEQSEQKWDVLRERLSIGKNYIFSVLAFDYNKNMVNICEAYRQYVEESSCPRQLFICCKIPNDSAKRSVAFFVHSNQLEKQLCFTDFLTEDELELMYKHASWMFQPTLYEGFGMPVLEAWEHDLPVVTSTTTSLGEIANGAAVLVEPTSIKELKDAFHKIEQMDEEERRRYISLGKERATHFSWEKTARQFLDKMNELYAK